MTGNEIKRKVENFRGVCAPKFGDFFFNKSASNIDVIIVCKNDIHVDWKTSFLIFFPNL